MTGHQQPVNHISFSPDGRFIASASFDKKVKLWNGITGSCVEGGGWQVPLSACGQPNLVVTRDC